MAENSLLQSEDQEKEPLMEQASSSPPTSTDVARLAKVSRATVSYVLNDVPNSRISEATKERVLQAAAKLGYVPHEMASSLRSGRSDLVLLPFFDWPYNQGSIAFLQNLALQIEKLGYTVMIRFFGRGDKQALTRKIASFHPVGVIVVEEEISPAEIEILTRNGVQAILAYGWTQSVSIPSIGVDFAIVGERAGRYLVDKGHRDIAVIVPRDERILHLGLQRLEGVERAAKQVGARVERVDLGFNTHEAAILAKKWAAGPRPTAVFTYNDEYGLLLMSALQDIGLNIPEDIALIGCDNLPLGEMLRPRLTSVDLGSGTIREIAAHFDRMIRGQSHDLHARIEPEFTLVIRESA